MATKNSKPVDTPADAKGKKTYTVLVVINHDGDLYEVGDAIDLTDKQAEPLLNVNAVVLPDQAAE
jgi:hypothetical protein